MARDVLFMGFIWCVPELFFCCIWLCYHGIIFLSVNFTKDLLVLLSFLIKLTWKKIWEKWLHEVCREKQRELWFYFLFISFYFCECLWKNLRYSSGLRKHFASLNESSCLESMRALSLIPAGALVNFLQDLSTQPGQVKIKFIYPNISGLRLVAYIFWVHTHIFFCYSLRTTESLAIFSKML